MIKKFFLALVLVYSIDNYNVSVDWKDCGVFLVSILALGALNECKESIFKKNDDDEESIPLKEKSKKSACNSVILLFAVSAIASGIKIYDKLKS